MERTGLSTTAQYPYESRCFPQSPGTLVTHHFLSNVVTNVLNVQYYLHARTADNRANQPRIPPSGRVFDGPAARSHECRRRPGGRRRRPRDSPHRSRSGGDRRGAGVGRPPVLYGAGTSGRLGVLDAAECPPTFGVPPDLVRGIMAGGERALRTSVGRQRRRSGRPARATWWRRDSVRATFWWGLPPAAGRRMCLARWEKRARSAVTCGISCTPDSELSRAVDYPIEPKPGPEILTGSTRLRAGTATKLVLNMISTAVMIRLGHVYGNLMVNVQPTNQKLEDRARRIIRAGHRRRVRTGGRAAGGGGRSVRTAIVMEKKQISARRSGASAGAERGADSGGFEIIGQVCDSGRGSARRRNRGQRREELGASGAGRVPADGRAGHAATAFRRCATSRPCKN